MPGRSRGQGHLLQPQDRRRAGCFPPGGQDRRRRHRERDMPGHARQIAQQRRHQRRVIRLRHERHQKHRPQRQRGGHRPPAGALDLPGQLHLRRYLADRVMLPGHLIQLLLQYPQPGMIRRVPAGLHAPVAAHHRSRDDDRLAEHHQVPGRGSGRRRRPSARSGPPRGAPAAPGRPGQPPGSRPASRRADPAATPPRQRHHWPAAAKQDMKAQGAPGDKKGVSTSSSTGSPSRNHVTRAQRMACRAPPAPRL